MIVVGTKEELQEAIKNKVDSIRIEGPYAGIVAQKIRSRKKVKKVAIGVGTLALVGGVIAAPFTGGASLAGSAVGLTAMGLTVGAVTLTTTQLAMLLGVGGSLLAYSIHEKSILDTKQSIFRAGRNSPPAVQPASRKVDPV